MRERQRYQEDLYSEDTRSDLEVLKAAEYRMDKEREYEGRILMNSFDDFYPVSGIEADKKRVEALEASFRENETSQSRDNKKYANILESILHDQIEMNEWFGPNVMTILTSKYDDYINGVDSVAEFSYGPAKRHLALAMDVTYSKELYDKFARLEDEIRTGSLSKIKYFQSEDHRGELSNVPRVIIGADKETLKRVMKLWSSPERKVRNSLQEDPLQLQILDQVLLQLDAFRIYADRIGKEKISDRFDAYYRVFDAIRRQKTDLYEKKEEEVELYRTTDRVFEEINHYSQRLSEM